MGGDNLVQIPTLAAVARDLSDGPDCRVRSPFLFSKGACRPRCERFARHRVPVSAARRLAEMEPPAWVFFHTRLDPRSATRIRSERKETLSQDLHGAQTRIVHDRRPDAPHPTRATATGTPRHSSSSICETLEDGKAEDIVTIDLAGKTTIADHMVIASGRSARQVLALTEHLDEVLSRRIADLDRGQDAGRLGADRCRRCDRAPVPARNPRLLQSRKDVGRGVARQRSGSPVVRDTPPIRLRLLAVGRLRSGPLARAAGALRRRGSCRRRRSSNSRSGAACRAAALKAREARTDPRRIAGRRPARRARRARRHWSSRGLADRLAGWRDRGVGRARLCDRRRRWSRRRRSSTAPMRSCRSAR